MDTALWVAAGVAVLALGWTFNGAVRLRNKAREAFSGIDVQLKRRHDLVPNLVRVVGAYARHEREALEEVTRLRGEAAAAAAIPDRERRETDLRGALDRLMVVVERYPDLKADGNFRRLQEDLVAVEDDLQYARRYYNATVRDYNTKIEQLPGNLVAALCRFEPLPFFQLAAGEGAAPTLSREELA
jgi:LemA protein